MSLQSIFPSRLSSLLVLICVLVLSTCSLPSLALLPAPSMLCTCRCCYQGGCNAFDRISWPVSSCSACTTKLCNEYITSKEVRTETARLFEGIESEDPFAIGNVVVQECEVISVLEAATCVTGLCKRTATIKAECYDRDAPLIKYSILSLVATTTVAVIFGLIKNYIPASQIVNERYFNY